MGTTVCRFTACDDTPAPKNYRQLKGRALSAGRFSVFEATATMTSATWFSRLAKDPEIELFDLDFPWTGVRRKEMP